LLQEHKTDINSLLLKHLDYYYKQVLNVKLKPYQPSKAYVTFEPAKNVNEYFIKTGSQLVAGKDVKGKIFFIKLNRILLLIKHVLGEIRSFTIIKNKEGQQNERTKIGEPLGIFAAPQANSSDGNGKPLSRVKVGMHSELQQAKILLTQKLVFHFMLTYCLKHLHQKITFR
jgi:hypothetical protein